MEIEPNEAERLPVPFFPDADLDLSRIDLLERGGSTNEILDQTDALLRSYLGLSALDTQRLRSIWDICGAGVDRG